MATLKQMEGRWRLVDSQGFDEYMKELGEARGPERPQRGMCVAVSSLGPHHCVGRVGVDALLQTP
jgi:hypothetical protein